jgi:hypothetical protein
VVLTCSLSAGEKGDPDEGNMPAEAPEHRSIACSTKAEISGAACEAIQWRAAPPG